ncbi:hypothetical protein BHM03_00003214 [Ensete ventricosum]|nr:hypothetical protein BHM03_00003214 [Ensete ventricosum]
MKLTSKCHIFSPFCLLHRYPFAHVSDIPAEPFCFTQRYLEVKKVLADTFFGSPLEGVYSPSVQNILYLMAKAVLNRLLSFPDFFPFLLQFADDVYMPTDEPHGTIEATVSRTISRM